MEIRFQVPKSLLTAMNQLYEIEQKLKQHDDPHGLQRNVSKMKDAFDACGLVYEDPMGQAFKETRTGADFSWGRAGIAAKIRYAFGIPRQGFQRRPLPDAMPERQHTR